MSNKPARPTLHYRYSRPYLIERRKSAVLKETTYVEIEECFEATVNGLRKNVKVVNVMGLQSGDVLVTNKPVRLSLHYKPVWPCLHKRKSV